MCVSVRQCVACWWVGGAHPSNEILDRCVEKNCCQVCTSTIRSSPSFLLDPVTHITLLVLFLRLPPPTPSEVFFFTFNRPIFFYIQSVFVAYSVFHCFTKWTRKSCEEKPLELDSVGDLRNLATNI